MQNILKNLSVVAFSIALIACEEDEPKQTPPPSMHLDGTYDLIDYQLEAPVDLNRDGVSSQDLLKEMEGGNVPAKRNLRLILSTIVLEGPSKTDYIQQIDLRVPLPHVITDGQTGEFLYNSYGYAWAAAEYNYSTETGFIITTPLGGYGKILAAQWDEASGVMSIKFEQDYYTTDWEKLTITGTYKKRL
jgi:hypothetical protein